MVLLVQRFMQSPLAIFWRQNATSDFNPTYCF